MKRVPLAAANSGCEAKRAPIEITPRLSSTYTGDQPWSTIAIRNYKVLMYGAL